MKLTRKRLALLLALTAVPALGLGLALRQPHSSTGFAMDTVVTQTAYGPAGPAALQAASQKLAQLESALSLYDPGSEIAAVNAAAGKQAVPLSRDTFALLETAQRLLPKAEGAFCLTMAPLTTLWGVASDTPCVPSDSQLAAALPLADDSALVLDAAACTAHLTRSGQGLDLGGIAKGYACDVLRQLYTERGVEHALLSIGGNVCAIGGKPDGQPFRIGFRDPSGSAGSCLASFLLREGVVAVSGGYERYFEQDGVRYHHILDPATGRPANSDIAAVGVVCQNGAMADLLSTTFFCWGRDKTLTRLQDFEVDILLLDTAGTLYVSPALLDGFTVLSDEVSVIVIEN